MDPAFLVSLNMKVDSLVDRFVCVFAGAIYLWVITRGHFEFTPVS